MHTSIKIKIKIRNDLMVVTLVRDSLSEEQEGKMAARSRVKRQEEAESTFTMPASV